VPGYPVHLYFDFVILLGFERKINGDGDGGQTTYHAKLTGEGQGWGGERRSERQSHTGREGTRECNGGGPLVREEGMYLDICARAPEFLVTPLLWGRSAYLARASLKSQSCTDNDTG